MSTQIDERIVSMRFDARDFNNNVQQTMANLEKFEKQLKLDGAQKGLEDVTKAANKVDLSHLEQAAVAVEAKFSLMSVAVISAINNIVTSAMNAGTQLVKSLSLDQVTSGFSKYEEKVKSVQTIMNATGLSIEEVSAQLDKLAWFTDETSYSFTDMVSNIGKFTSNQVPLDQAVTAMQGIANWAALSGQGVNEASRAMYNLSQAISVGSVKLIDWKSIENANMATAEFKQTVLDTAVAVGTLTKVSDGIYKVSGSTKDLTVSVTDFNSQLSQGWFNSEVLLKSLDKYGEYSERIYAEVQENGGLAADAMKRLGDAGMELGAKAFRAAQEAKTFSDAIEATKDAVSTGWMNTFEIIFGNYEEAKELWTELANTLYDIFAESGNIRNELLQSWKDLGGRTAMLDGITAAYEALLSIVTPLKQAFDEMFPLPTAERLVEITERVKEFFQALQLSEQAGYTLMVIFKTLLLPIKAVFTAIQIGVVLIASLIRAAFQLTDAFLSMLATTNPIENFFKNVFGDERYSRLMESIGKIIYNIGESLIWIGQQIVGVIKAIRDSEEIKIFLQTISDLLRPIGDLILDTIVSGFEMLANMDFKGLSTLGRTVLQEVGSKLNWIFVILDAVMNLFKSVGNTIASYFGFGDILGNDTKNVVTLKDTLSGLLDIVKNLKANFTLDTIFATLAPIGEKVASVVTKLGQAITSLVERLNPAKILLFAFGTALTGMMFAITGAVSSLQKVFEGFSGIGTAATRVLNSTANAIDNFGKPNRIRDIALAIAVLAASLVALSMVDSNNLRSAVRAMVELAITMGVLFAAIALLDRFVIKDNNKIGALATSILKISAALAVLSAGLWVLSKVDTEGLAGKVLAVIAIIAALGGIVTAISIFSAYDIGSDAAVLVAFGIALVLIVGSLKKLADLNTNALLQSVGGLIMLMGMLGLLSIAMGNIRFTGAVAVTLMIANLFLVMAALDALSKYPLYKIQAALPVYINMMGMLALLMIATNLAGQHAVKAGIFAIAISGALIILNQAIKALGEMDLQTVIQGTLIVSWLMTLFGGLTAVSLFAGQHAAKMGSALIMMAATIMLLTIPISYLGKLDTKAAIQGVAAVSALIIVIGVITRMNSALVASGQKFKSATSALIAMSVLLGTAASTLAILSLIPDQERLLTSALALGGMILAIGVAAKLVARTEKEVQEGSRVIKQGAGMLTVTWLLVDALAVIGLLNAMDLQNGIIEKAGALGIVLVAVGAAARLLPDFENFNWKHTADALLELSLCLVALSGVLRLVDGIDSVGAMANSVALSLLIVAVAGAARLLPDFIMFDWKNTAGALTELTICIGVLGLILGAMNGLNPVSAIANATALSELIIALSFSARLLPSFSNFNAINALAGLGMLSGCAVAVMAIIAVLQKHNLNVGIQNVLSLSILLVAMAASARIISGIGSVNLSGGIQALIVITVAIGILLGIIAIIKDYDWSGAQNAVLAFGAIGAALGEMIGQFIGHLNSASLSTLPEMGESLAGFFDSIRGIDSAAVDAALNLALAITAITGAEFLNSLANLVPGVGNTIIQFGKDLSELAPYLVSFVDDLGDIDSAKLVQASSAVKNLGEAASALSVGLFDAVGQAIFGTNTLQDFGKDLAEFGPYMKEFADSLGEIDREALVDATEAAKVLAEFEEALPKHNGVFQSIFGDADLGSFGTNIRAFGSALVGYSKAITEEGALDNDAIVNSVKSGEGLAKLERSLRSQGGRFQTIFGDANLGQFAFNIKRFGSGMKSYSDSITENGGLDIEAMKQSGEIGTSLSKLENSLIGSNGTWQNIFGGQENLGLFATNIAFFGEGIRAYSNSLTKDGGVDFDALEKSQKIGEALSSLESSLGTTNGVLDFFTGGGSRDFSSFGSSLESLGKAIKKYDESISQVVFGRVDESIASLEKLVNLSSWMYYVSTDGITGFTSAINDLADGTVKSFIEEFEGSEKQIANAIAHTISNAIFVTQNDNKKYYSGVGLFFIAQFISGLVEGEKQLSEQLKLRLLNSLMFAKNDAEVWAKSKEIGTNMIKGVINGIETESPNLNRKVRDNAKMMLDVTKEVLDEHSPSVEFQKIGENAMIGLAEGVEQNQQTVNKTMKATTKGILNEAINDFQIQNGRSEAMRDQVGVYLIKGIAEGITTETSAEEAMKKKAENIVNAFRDAMAIYSYESEMSDLGYSIWSKRYESEASDDQIKDMKNLNLRDKMDAAAQELAANRAKLSALELAGFDKTTSEWREANTAVGKSVEKLEDLINEFLDLNAIPDVIGEKIDKVNENISRYSDQVKAIDQEYEIWYNRFGASATEKELEEMNKLNLEKKLEMAGQSFAANEALLQLTLDKFGEGTQEYIDAQSAMRDAEIQYQKLINEYLELVNPAKEKTEDIALAYQQAAMSYNEIMGNKELISRLTSQGYTEERIKQWASEISGLEELMNPKPDKITYDTIWDKYVKSMESEMPDIPTPTVPEYDFDDLFDYYTSAEFEVQIDAAGEVIKDVTKEKTKKAATSAARSGVSEGLTSGLTAGIDDFMSGLQNGTGTSAYSGFSNFPDAIRNILGLDNPETWAPSANSLSSVWENIVNGADEGLSGIADVATNTLGNGIQQGVDWLMNIMGIHSPSTVMIEIGHYIMQGLQIGLEDGTNNVFDVFKNLIDELLDTTSNNTYFYQAGELLASAMIDGLINGVRNRQAEAINEVIQLASQMYQAACQELGIGNGMNLAVEKVYGSVGGGGGGGGGTSATYFDDTQRKALNSLLEDVKAGKITNDEYWSQKKGIIGEKVIVVGSETSEKQAATISATLSTAIASGINSAMNSSKSTQNLQNGTTNGTLGTTYNFYQTNNSPTALSRIDIYRDTKNLLSSAKGVT